MQKLQYRSTSKTQKQQNHILNPAHITVESSLPAHSPKRLKSTLSPKVVLITSKTNFKIFKDK